VDKTRGAAKLDMTTAAYLLRQYVSQHKAPVIQESEETHTVITAKQRKNSEMLTDKL
jgi:hypothetical protein